MTTEWYYEHEGQPKGPVAESDIAAMLANGSIRPNTRVWTAAFGQEWKQASQTQLVSAGANVAAAPPPIASGAASNASAASQQATATPPAFTFVPPYQKPTELYAYLLALLPLPMLVVDAFLFTTAPGDPSVLAGDLTGFIALWGSILFAALDARNVYRSHRNLKHRTMVPFVLLTPIGYFWRRHVIIGASKKYLFTWLATFLIWAYCIGTMME